VNRIHFTKFALDGLACVDQGKPFYVYDDKARGLCVYVSSTVKTFYLLRKVAGRAERIKIGRYPDTTIEQARKRAGSHNSEIDSGANPNQVKRQRREELTLADLYTAYMERHVIPNNKRPDNTARDYRLYLEPWGGRRLSEIERGDVQVLHVKLSARGQRTANIALGLLRAMFNRAKEWGLWSENNPTEGIRKFTEKARQRFILPAELPRFYDELRRVESEITRDFFLICLLTGARRGNVQAMRWNDVHLDDALWIIPDSKNGEPYTVHLVPEAVAVLRKRAAQDAREFVFPGPGKAGHLQEPKRAWASLCERAGLADLRVHDLRRTYGSYLAASGASLLVIGKALGHKSADSTAIYARLNLDPVREAAKHAAPMLLKGAGDLVPAGPSRQEGSSA
jgi:integrase